MALGANIGTTLTAQLIAFKINEVALPAIAVGVAMRLFAQKRRKVNIGGVVLGFGLLFFRHDRHENGGGPLETIAPCGGFFHPVRRRRPGRHFFLCILTGAVATMIIQSSSATVGLTMTLASQGLITFPGAVALVLGDNIGTCVTAELASIGTGVAAHRTARTNTMFNVLGVTYMVILFPFFTELVVWLTTSFLHIGPPEAVVNGEMPNAARYVANAHTMFNVINAMLFLFILPILVRVGSALTLTREKEEELDILTPQYLDPHFLKVTPVALRQVRREIQRMGEIGEKMMDEVIHAMDGNSRKQLNKWRQKEEALDHLQKEITNYLVALSQGDMSLEDSGEISNLMRMTNNLERVGDTVENIAELIEEMIDNDIKLTEEGLNDYREISEKAHEFYKLLLRWLSGQETVVIDVASKLEDEIDFMREDMRARHLARLRLGACTIDPGLIFTDMLNHFEKIGDYCYNVAKALNKIK